MRKRPLWTCWRGSCWRALETLRYLAGLVILAIAMILPVGSGVAASSGHVPTALEASSTQNPEAEQHLVEKYAPIVGLKRQEGACDSDGEPWFPVSVDATLGQSGVTLKRATSKSSGSDQVLVEAPGPQDLFGLGENTYLDMPGNPRRPGCTYEKWFDSTSAGATPVTYAHIVKGDGKLAVQYWFYYVFNRFNNTHESDWEMMQLVFDVDSVEAALQAQPVAVGLAQHGGGESAAWSSSKLQRDGDRPIVYAAAGSHATQFDTAVYLGWGENGTGFGCDTTIGPTDLVPLTAVLLPSSVDDDASDFAWLAFTGRWGERQAGEYSGPTGPNTKSQWTDPFSWQAALRTSSLKVPGAKTFGPAPTNVFCNLSAAGSDIFRELGDRPPKLLAVVAVILAGLVGFLKLAWYRCGQAIGIYRQRWQTFILIGLWLIPVGIAFNGFRFLVTDFPPGSTLFKLLDQTPGASFSIAMLLLILQHLAGLIVVGPMVIELYRELGQDRNLSFRESWDHTWKALPELARTVGLAIIVLITLSITLIGIPVAIWLLVRWMFLPQAAILDHQFRRNALEASTASIKGRWWRAMLTALAIFVLAAAPGAMIGLVFLILGNASVQFINVVSSLVYVVTVPVSILAMTLLYRENSQESPAASTMLA